MDAVVQAGVHVVNASLKANSKQSRRVDGTCAAGYAEECTNPGRDSSRCSAQATLPDSKAGTRDLLAALWVFELALSAPPDHDHDERRDSTVKP